MEVTPEIFAWLNSLNIVDYIKALKEQQDNIFIIPERTIELLIGGKYMDIILKSLEDSYNTFYKVKLNYTDCLSKLRQINEDDEYIPNSVKYHNWRLISETLSRFGMSYTDEQISKITAGDRELLLEVLNKIYSINNELLKKSNDQTQQKSIATIQNNAISSSNKIGESKLIKSISTEVKDKNLNKTNQISKKEKIEKNETINLGTFEPNKDYDSFDSPLEFLIASLSKNFELNPRQAVALLSNNRKYLSILCNKGLKGNFTKICKWQSDLSSNIKILIQLLKKWPDGLEIAYAIIGTALCSKEGKISLTSAEIMSHIQSELGSNWDWLIKEGIDSFIFAIIKHDEFKLKLTKLLYDFISNRLTDFILEFKKKVVGNDKKKIYDLFSAIIPIMRQLNINFYKELESFIFDLCLNESNDKPLAISLLADMWFYLNPMDEDMMTTISNYMKNCVRLSKENIALTAVAQLFSLMQRFGNSKDENGPRIYKMIVFLMLENYDNEIKREFFLLNFEKLFNSYVTIPIDIFLIPYLKQVKNCQNFALCDLMFIFKMIEHPRITGDNLVDILEFILNVTLHNVALDRTGNLILSLIFEKKLIQNLCNENEIVAIKNLFVEYIKTAIEMFKFNLKSSEDPAILETSYDIIGENFLNIINDIHDAIVDAITEYRKVKGKNSTSLLAMLWVYDDHDYILLQLEEKFRPKYEPVEVTKEKEKKKQEELDRKDFKKKQINLLSQLQDKKRDLEIQRELQKNETLQKEKTLKSKLVKKRERKTLMLGLNYQRNKLQLESLTHEIQNFSPPEIETTQEIKTEKGSTMKSIIKSATENFQKKNKFQIIRTKSDNMINTVNNNINNNHNKILQQKDDIKERFGHVISVDRRKEMQLYNEEIKQKIKLITTKELIVNEGSVIKDSDRNFNSLSNMSNRARMNYITSDVYKNFILPIDLEEEENRETIAIEGYNKQYKNNLKLYFRTYYHEVKKTISKANILKMLREKGYNKYEINLEELSIAMRNLFGDNINELSFDEFSALLVQLSYLIYTKKRDTLTISECYGNLLRHLNPNVISDATIKINKEMKPIVDLIFQKLRNPKDENDSYFNMPPGFKLIDKTSVVYNCRLAPHFIPILGEAKYICYELMEEILFNILNSSVLEPYVKVSTKSEIVLNPVLIHNWSKDLTVAYINLDIEDEKIGIEAADCLEDGLRRLCKGRDKKGNLFIPPVIRNVIEESRKFSETENRKEEKRKKRREEIRQAVENFKIEKQKQKKEKERKNRERYKEIKKQMKEEQEENKKIYEKVQERKKQIEEEKHNKLIEVQQRQKEEAEKKYLERKEYFNKQQRRLKVQFVKIMQQRKVFLENKIESGKYKLPEAKHKFKKDIKFIEFESNLNQTIKNLIQRDDIKAVLSKYENHLKLIYNIYSKIGFNKISFFSNESMHENEFKEFLTNFTVLGLLISTEQMKFIFRKITNDSRDNKDEQSFFLYDEFLQSIVYLSIYSRFTERSRKILPTDIDNTNAETIENFLIFLGLTLPFDKLSLETFINERRAMTMKNLIKLQREIRKERIGQYRVPEKEKEFQKQREEKKQKAIEHHKEKLQQKEEENKLSGEENVSQENNNEDIEKEEEQKGQVKAQEQQTGKLSEKAQQKTAD